MNVRRQALEAWLTKHNAHCMWDVVTGPDGAKVPGRIEAWLVPAARQVILINHYANGAGWDIYTAPAASENKVDATLAAVEQAIGLQA